PAKLDVSKNMSLFAEIVPLLLTPPAAFEFRRKRAQSPGAVIVPALTTEPPTVAPLMRMALLIDPPVGATMKGLVLVTLPAVLSEATVPDVTLIAQGAATTRGAAPPMISAAADDDASSSPDRRAREGAVMRRD